MKKDLATKKNLDLLNEFMKYAFEHPAVLEKIPHDAELIILPIGDPELHKHNMEMGNRIISQGRKIIYARMKRPKVSVPKLEMASVI